MPYKLGHYVTTVKKNSQTELTYARSQFKQIKLFYTGLLSIFLLSSVITHAANLTVLVTDKKGAVVENAVVYLEAFNEDALLGSNSKQADSNNFVPATPVTIEQKNKTFIPLVTVVQTGTNVTFPNRDSVRHHVYSFSPAKTFELKLYSGVPATPILFDKAGTAVLGCNIHDKMLAFVHVVNTPYFAKTDTTGKALLAVPNTPYVLKVWHYALLNENKVFEKKINLDKDMHDSVILELKPFKPQK